jgi:hypothetical protein
LPAPVGWAAISNPLGTQAIAETKTKTDMVDATVLVQLLGAAFLPEGWMPDDWPGCGSKSPGAQIV